MQTTFSLPPAVFDPTPLSTYFRDDQGWIGEYCTTFKPCEPFGYGDDPPEDSISQLEAPECVFEELTFDEDDDDDDYSTISSEDEDLFEPVQDLDPDLWGGLPQEIILIIRGHLIDQAAQDSPSKVLASKFSLVSRSWSDRLRPRLFQSLHLASTDDVTFLGTLLSSPTSAWLCDHIFAITCSASPSERVFRTLGRMRALHHLQILCPSPYLFARSIASKQALCNLRSLEIQNCVFPSLSALLRNLGDAPGLQSLVLANVRWTLAAGAQTCCPARVPHLRHFEVEGCTDDNTLAGWLMVASVVDVGWREAGFSDAVRQLVASLASVLGGFAAREVICDRLENDAAGDRFEAVLLACASEAVPPASAAYSFLSESDHYISSTLQ